MSKIFKKRKMWGFEDFGIKIGSMGISMHGLGKFIRYSRTSDTHILRIKIDPEFTNLLKRIHNEGVRVNAISTEFVLPDRVYLRNDDLAIRIFF